MRLTSKYRLYSVTTLLCVVVTSFIANYYLYRHSIHRTTDDVLKEYRIDIEEYAVENDTLPPFRSLEMKHSNLTVVSGVKGPIKIDETICDTLIFSDYQKEMVVYRKLMFPVTTSHRCYVVTLMLPTLEEDNLIGTVLLSLVLVVLLFILFSSVTDLFFARKISRPFNKILASIRSYDIERPSTVELKHYDIDEFQELNQILQGMMSKINRDYTNMKEFLENTSHELQTPLSIIQMKLETLLQADITDEETLKNLHSISQAVNRMIRFNRSLLFLAKINNDQYAETQTIDLNQSIHQFLDLYQELLDVRQIRLEISETSHFTAKMHPLLAEHLTQNLLTNAVKHNIEGGDIHLSLSADCIEISNTFTGQLPEGNLFERYRFIPNKVESSGLGLTIIKNICDKSKLSISYRVEQQRFILSIRHQQ